MVYVFFKIPEEYQDILSGLSIRGMIMTDKLKEWPCMNHNALAEGYLYSKIKAIKLHISLDFLNVLELP